MFCKMYNSKLSLITLQYVILVLKQVVLFTYLNNKGSGLKIRTGDQGIFKQIRCSSATENAQDRYVMFQYREDRNRGEEKKYI